MFLIVRKDWWDKSAFVGITVGHECVLCIGTEEEGHDLSAIINNWC